LFLNGWRSVLEQRIKKYVLLDFDGNPIRYFNHPATGAVEVVHEEYKVDWNDFEPALF